MTEKRNEISILSLLSATMLCGMLEVQSSDDEGVASFEAVATEQKERRFYEDRSLMNPADVDSRLGRAIHLSKMLYARTIARKESNNSRAYFHTTYGTIRAGLSKLVEFYEERIWFPLNGRSGAKISRRWWDSMEGKFLKLMDLTMSLRDFLEDLIRSGVVHVYSRHGKTPKRLRLKMYYLECDLENVRKRYVHHLRRYRNQFEASLASENDEIPRIGDATTHSKWGQSVLEALGSSRLS